MTPATWMDRLSDRIGSLIPGGYQLPPRHPVKVSLVVLVLGIFAGWAESIPIAIAAYSSHRQFMDGVWLVRPAAAGAFVVFPLAIWSGQTWWRAGISALISIALLGFLSFLIESIGIAKFRSYPGINAPQSTVILFYVIAACVGLLMGIVIMNAVHSRWSLRILAAISVPGSLYITELLGRWTSTPLMDNLFYSGHAQRQTLALSCVTLQLALVPLSLAFCLGCALWDGTPRPRFESDSDAGP